jgi:hypothetical protein
MNGFLVLLRHTMDDLPITLCETLEQAEKIARNVEKMPNDWIRAVYNSDCSMPCNVSVVEFRHGQPSCCWVLRMFE